MKNVAKNINTQKYTILEKEDNFNFDFDDI